LQKTKGTTKEEESSDLKKERLKESANFIFFLRKKESANSKWFASRNLNIYQLPDRSPSILVFFFQEEL